MIRQIAPQFFTTDLPATLAYYQETLGFECLGTWSDPPVYAIVARDEHRIHFRLATSVLGLMVGQALRLVLAGLGLGLVAAAALSRPLGRVL